MHDILIVDSKDPLNMLFKLKQLDNSRNYDLLISDEAEAVIDNIQVKEKLNIEQKEERIRLCAELMRLRAPGSLDYSDEHAVYKFLKLISYEIYDILKSNNLDGIRDKLDLGNLKISKYYAYRKRRAEHYKKYLDKKLMEVNNFSEEDIKNLCYEYYNDFVKVMYPKLYPKAPIVKILKLGDYIKRHNKTVYEDIILDLRKRIKENTNYYTFFGSELVDCLISNIPLNFQRYFGGISTYFVFEDFVNIKYNNAIKNDSKIKKIWRWYKKSLNVFLVDYIRTSNTCYVIKKPDELKIDTDKNDVYFRYGQEEFYYKNKAKIPVWLYKTDVRDWKVKDYLLLANADAKAVFIEKIGIDRLAKYGTVIDTYENYPDNEMWEESEYKIIDMHKIIPPKQIVDQWGYKRGKAKPYRYAPFLYMKNQTTGVYHLEGIHPRCKTLYDAIKMRYNGLNIKDYEIKDIK